MNGMEIFLIAVALVAGFAVAWVLADARVRKALRGEIEAREQRIADLDARRQASERLGEELRAQMDMARRETEAERAKKEEEQRARVKAETELREAQKGLEDQRKALEDVRTKMAETFDSLASAALKATTDEFLKLAGVRFDSLKKEASGELTQRQQAIQGLVEPLTTSLVSLDQKIAVIEASRKQDQGQLIAQLGELAKSSQELRQETGSLVTSLRQPQIKGRWGELTLKRAVELAGMSVHCDFVEQESVETDEGRLRPDMVVKLVGGRKILVDAKVPLHAYWKIDSIRNQEEYQQVLEEHARLVRSHVNHLSRKNYGAEFASATDFVVLFLPGESFFSAAVQKDPTLIADAMEKRIVLASPTTLIALLRAIAYGWQQAEMAENAQRVSEIGKELYKRILKFVEHLQNLRGGLERVNRSFNEAVGSLEHNLLPGARKFRELGVQTTAELPGVEPTETALRPLAVDDSDE